MITAALLTLSNIFMTFAWYGHLKFKNTPLWQVVLISWAIALLEYCFQVPANRIGSEQNMTGAQLKIMQEAITLGVFLVFSVFYLKEAIKTSTLVGFSLVLLGVFVIFRWR